MLITRKQYMDNQPRYVPGEVPDIFRAYYAQFISDSVKQAVIARFGIERLLASADIYFNDLPLADWDRMAGGSGSASGGLLHAPYWAPLARMKEAGDYYTLAGGVCILKEAARIACEEYRAREDDK